MPPRNPELPEGTDHIISGAMETGAGADASTGSSGGLGSGAAAPGGDTGFVASGGSAGGLGDGTGGTSVGGSTGSGLSSSGGGSSLGSGTGGGSGGTSSSGGGAAEKLASQVRDQVYGLREQATEKARQLADTGKGQVTSTLTNLTDIVNEAARQVDERFGEQYGQYAHRAADAVSSLATTIEGKSLEDMIEDTRSAVRKSPAIALGTAALLGFALMRVVKAGLPLNGDGGDGNQRGTTGGTSGRGGTANRTDA
jgi:hypothetical protein